MSSDTLVALFLAGAILGGVFGLIRGHNVLVAILVGAFLTPIGPLLVLFVPAKKRCPQCKERIQRKAVVCRFCQYRYPGAT